ncbi:HEAT repeat domain-containing protein [Planctomicrobium sp. SH664]|uniref:HEAT repeat domain-containing protein n=1 Tax=Planctomicrobium sp. SH664 TaxID=3448125 RepID=UPI003F5BA7EE
MFSLATGRPSRFMFQLLLLWAFSTCAPDSCCAAKSKAAPRSLAELKQTIQREAERTANSGLAQTSEQPIVLWTEKAFIGTSNAFSETGLQYLQALVVVGNGTDRPLKLRPTGITLAAGGKTYAMESRRRGFTPLPFNSRSPGAAFPYFTEAAEIAPGETRTLGVMFLDLEVNPPVPQMRVRFVFEDNSVAELDLNSQFNDRLGLTVRRIGPHQAAALLTIRGELNTINIDYLANQLNEVYAAGTHRAVVEWAPGAPACDDQLLGWLLHSTTVDGRTNPIFQRMSVLPAMRRIVLSQLPELNQEAIEHEEFNKDIFPKSELAAADLLSDLLQVIDRRALLHELRNGDPVLQPALIRAGSRRLGREILPLILEILNGGQNETLREEAILALGRQSDPASTERLQKLLEDPATSVQETALRSLLSSGSPDSREAVLGVLRSQRIGLPADRIISQMVRYYHPAWDDYLIQRVTDPNADVRCIALSALNVVGHSQLRDVCVRALKDPNEKVRETAFEILVDRPQKSEQQAAVHYALERLQKGEVSPPVLYLIHDLREPRAAPLLLELLKKPHPLRPQMINVLGDVGSDADLQKLLSQFDRFEPEEQAAITALAGSLSPEMQMDLAARAVKSEEPAVRQSALEILRHSRNPQSLKLIETLCERADAEEYDRLCRTLGEMGTTSTLKLLRKLRERAAEANDEFRVGVARLGIDIWMKQSPGWTYVQIGDHHSRDEQWLRGVNAYSLALEIDANLLTAYSRRGSAHLHLQELESARQDFSRALELDPEDPESLTGIAIVWAMSGEWKRAVEIVDKHHEAYAKNFIYLYNTACVYGRAIETLKNLPQSAERDQDIRKLEERAIEKLQLAVELGFDDFGHMQKDPDLATLQDLEKFKLIIRSPI